MTTFLLIFVLSFVKIDYYFGTFLGSIWSKIVSAKLKFMTFFGVDFVKKSVTVRLKLTNFFGHFLGPFSKKLEPAKLKLIIFFDNFLFRFGQK